MLFISKKLISGNSRDIQWYIWTIGLFHVLSLLSWCSCMKLTALKLIYYSVSGLSLRLLKTVLQDLLYGLSRDCSCFSDIKRQSHLADSKMQICVGCPFPPLPPCAHIPHTHVQAHTHGHIPHTPFLCSLRIYDNSKDLLTSKLRLRRNTPGMKIETYLAYLNPLYHCLIFLQFYSVVGNLMCCLPRCLQIKMLDLNFHCK